MSYSTVPKYWKGWRDVGSDCNWEDYHGLWGRRAPDGTYFFLTFTNMEDACGRDALEGDNPMRYHCDVRQVAPKELDAETVAGIMSSFGWDEEDMTEMTTEEVEWRLATDAAEYGVYAPLHQEGGMSYPARIRAACYREAENLMTDVVRLDDRLNRPVNRIGSTARDLRGGDIMAGLTRYQEAVAAGGEDGDPVKELMCKLHGVQPAIKQVKQRLLTGECWLVQLHGASACDECEAYGTAECGGQDILKTGVSDKGHKVGGDGLENEDLLGPVGPHEREG